MATLADVTLTAAGTAQTISSSLECLQAVFQAHPDNTSNIRVGDSSTDVNRGVLLEPGDVWVCEFSPVGNSSDFNLNTFLFDGSTTGDRICVSYF